MASVLAANIDFPRRLKSTEEYINGMREIADNVMSAAIDASPRETGHYADSFAVVVIDGTVYVTNFDIAAHLIEWGGAKTPAYAPLRRGVRAAGLTIREQ